MYAIALPSVPVFLYFVALNSNVACDTSSNFSRDWRHLFMHVYRVSVSTFAFHEQHNLI